MMTEFDYLAAFEAIKRLAASRAPVSERMAALIGVCESQFPQADWTDLKQLPFDQDARRIAQWLRRFFEMEPPESQLEGLWFGLFNPVLADGSASAEVHLVGSAAFDPDDEAFEWAVDADYIPEDADAKSEVLARLYTTAYRSEAALQNVAECPLALGYAAFAIGEALRTIGRVSGAVANVGVAVGFDSGDGLLLGQLTPQGFVEAGPAA